MKSNYRNKNRLIERTIKAVRFLESIRGKCFTNDDLADAIGLSARHARPWVDALSLYYPISIVRESGLVGYGRGMKPALFRVEDV